MCKFLIVRYYGRNGQGYIHHLNELGICSNSSILACTYYMQGYIHHLNVLGICSNNSILACTYYMQERLPRCTSCQEPAYHGGRQKRCGFDWGRRRSGSGRSPGEEHGTPLQYSCLENPTDTGAWRAAVHRVSESRTRLKWLSRHTDADEGRK